MDQAPQPEDAAANTEREERRADEQRRIEEVAGVLAETLLGMWCVFRGIVITRIAAS